MILESNNENSVQTAAGILKNGGVICFATETVYALACDASTDLAVARLYKIKKRDLKKPIAVFVKNLQMAREFLDFNAEEEVIAKKFMPGMVTLVLKKKLSQERGIFVSTLLNDNASDLGLRIPNHRFCLDLLNEFGGVIAATSANLSKHKAATNYEQAAGYFKNKIDLIIDGGVCAHKVASTVLRVDGGIKIIRAGLITKDQLEFLSV